MVLRCPAPNAEDSQVHMEPPDLVGKPAGGHRSVRTMADRDSVAWCAGADAVRRIDTASV